MTKCFSNHTWQHALIHCFGQWMSKLWPHLPDSITQLFPFQFNFFAEEVCKVLLEAVTYVKDNHTYS